MMSRKDRRGEKPLRRRVATRAPRKTLLILCEGSRTEPEYLHALKSQPTVRNIAAVELRIQPTQGSTPLTLVRAAVEARQVATDEEGEVDEVWCAFDVEWPQHHPTLKEAVTFARDHGVRLAVSNPCFELWLALHFKDHRGCLETNAKAIRLRRKLDGSTDKGLNANLYMPLRETARQRAEALERMHEEAGRVLPKNNPSSGMHRLLSSVESPPPQEGS